MPLKGIEVPTFLKLYKIRECKQMRMFRKTISILVLVFFVVALTAASASACECKEKCKCEHKEKCKCGHKENTIIIVKNEVKPVITVEPEMNNYVGGCNSCGWGWGGCC